MEYLQETRGPHIEGSPGICVSPARGQASAARLAASLGMLRWEVFDRFANKARRLPRLPGMTPAVLAELVRSVAHDVLIGRGLDPVVLQATVIVERSRNPEQSDYAANVALRTGKVPVGPRVSYEAKAAPCSEVARWVAAQGLSRGRVHRHRARPRPGDHVSSVNGPVPGRLIGVALLGCGTVRRAVVRLLTEQFAELAARAGGAVRLVGVGVRCPGGIPRRPPNCSSLTSSSWSRQTGRTADHALPGGAGADLDDRHARLGGRHAALHGGEAAVLDVVRDVVSLMRVEGEVT